MALKYDEAKIRAALDLAWSLETAPQWSAENPANGQCNVTAAVICDLFGGAVLRTRIGDLWHYYNQIDGRRADLSDSQFTRPNARFDLPNPYEDKPTTRDAAMVGIPQREYDALRSALLARLE